MAFIRNYLTGQRCKDINIFYDIYLVFYFDTLDMCISNIFKTVSSLDNWKGTQDNEIRNVIIKIINTACYVFVKLVT